MSAAPALPEKPKGKRPIGWIIAAAVVVVAIVVALIVGAVRSGGSDDGAAAGGSPKTVTIGVADKSLSYWSTYTKLAKSKLNVTVKLTNFSDYSLPNPALKDKQLDLNQFQHIQYLADYNVTSNDDLQPIGSTAVYPLPLYATKYDDVADLPEGAKVAIPDDSINQARALLILQAAKLVTLKDGGSAFSTTTDIESSKVDVQPLNASQTANALQQGSVAAAVVNNNYATAAGLPISDAIYQDDPSSASAAPYVNVFAVRNADKDNTTYLDLAKLFQDESVQKVFKKDLPEAVSRDESASSLQEELAKVEQDAKAAKQ
ncbi:MULTISPECIES: MetQ/NlpA family ABC transporter substrate-binding protein [unclassified Curtobacterium]|jgi:D-methionine transport system substrate-binding protein|uniref:MetQ/NlpA family ABC transporter substrate-binding protein n=1 Tax=unclassified Curtobacterium TaxID=257496 RepID=UPI0008DD4533|nr:MULTISPECIES: MetQ/NlpA family ABC transporter substrate-binding protein [unclassified Curtobacterium]MCC8908424.1 metal ABC transporter substrate-binding protein [Curtobacterium sp. GD1]MCT9622666.1 metal ABC transporter substrate-binding protein [Curtobacterium sp. C2H10]OII22970.1 metal ABC transporter substrate-binding protein [Curtobacterium sp. MCBA15_013]OII28001.1 metal ABC transporter substrate-binding protein [Curtobacterium sp. MCBA15_016]SFF64086.1 D-methionine transport system 